MKRLLVTIILCCTAPWVAAHKASDAYLQLQDGGESTLSVKFSMALRDLDAAFEALDADNNRAITWAEVQNTLPQTTPWLTQGLQLHCGDQPLPLAWKFDALEQRSDGVYVRWQAPSRCPQGAVGVDYTLMRTLDATHRLIASGSLRGQAVAGTVSPQSAGRVLLAGTGGAQGSTGWPVLQQFFPEGVHHIATGYDHLAFLLALLLPIMLWRRNTQGGQGTQGSQGLMALLRTVTGFTLGHSITLGAASLGLITSPNWVEPAIAATIAASALLNLYPLRWLRGDALALGFGLIHGLGFSNIMSEANVSASLLPWALAGFNLGVEAGQLLGVALWCAVHWVLARFGWYHKVVVRGGSWALMLLALYWLLQRLELFK
jgi:HupE / UreJ protein